MPVVWLHVPQYWKLGQTRLPAIRYPHSAVCSSQMPMMLAAAEEINKIFFEVIIAPDYDVDALEILGQKKNRIILVRKQAALPKKQFRSLLNGVLVQDRDLKVETPEDLKTVTTKADCGGS